METQNKTDEFSTDNIFSEISWDLDFGDVKDEDLDVSQKRNYLKMLNNTVKGLNVLVLLSLVFTMWFIFISKTETSTFSYLNPVCKVFVWEVPLSDEGCSGVAYYENYYDNLLNERKYTTLAKVLPLIKDKFSNENYLKSIEVQLLLDKTSAKIKPTDIISDFDKIKDEAAWNSKTSIECSNLNISNDWTFDVKCSFYSYGFNTDVAKETNIYNIWTSMTRAANFQKELDASDKFTIIEKQRSFNNTDVTDSVYGYQYKTDLNIKAKYNKWTFINY